MITLSDPQLAALSSAHFSAAYFTEFQFTNGTLRISSWNTNLDWGGYTWIGTGALGSISEVKESEKLQSMSLDFTLTVADPAFIATALSAAETYRNKAVYVYVVPMDQGAQVGVPVLTWSGVMDQMMLSLTSSGGSVTLRCFPAADKLEAAANLRVNDATQKATYPTSRGLEYQTGLIADPHLWLSKDFQAQRYGS